MISLLLEFYVKMIFEIGFLYITERDQFPIILMC